MKRKYLYGFIFISLILISYLLWNFVLDTPQRAENRFRSYLISKNYEKSPSGYDNYYYNVSRFGSRSWIVSYGPYVVPSSPAQCIIDSEGNVSNLTAESLSKLMREEFDYRLHDKDHNQFIDRFLGILHGEKVVILDDVEIKKLQLFKDIPQDLHSLKLTQDRVEILFTYQQIGGMLRRYEFHYTSSGKFKQATMSEIARGVGPAKYYE